jgi:NADH:ubiquinone oxidoreductase subunit E
MPLIEAALQASGLETEGDTSDGRLTLRYNTCLGACSQAPVMAIDHHLIGRATPESAKARIAELLAEQNG